MAVQDGPVFCSAIGEDRSRYRAEVEGIRRLLMAAQVVPVRGRLVVISRQRSSLSRAGARRLGRPAVEKCLPEC